ncbi:hypothetical protein [Flammeovirga pacifica]|uniref:Lipoprotein n=1 Tax=Flammeovirga pacifica TaxID=915059 RepID=A0A1S1YUR1_FLAPC|nr:hypothetical protein [Flammeovirga pacifica]OHX64555.1 hypothetical protein NH26_23570 [Flammeovirga pacifica]
MKKIFISLLCLNVLLACSNENLENHVIKSYTNNNQERGKSLLNIYDNNDFEFISYLQENDTILNKTSEIPQKNILYTFTKKVIKGRVLMQENEAQQLLSTTRFILNATEVKKDIHSAKWISNGNLPYIIPFTFSENSSKDSSMIVEFQNLEEQIIKADNFKFKSIYPLEQ